MAALAEERVRNAGRSLGNRSPRCTSQTRRSRSPCRRRRTAHHCEAGAGGCSVCRRQSNRRSRWVANRRGRLSVQRLFAERGGGWRWRQQHFAAFFSRARRVPSGGERVLRGPGAAAATRDRRVARRSCGRGASTKVVEGSLNLSSLVKRSCRSVMPTTHARCPNESHPHTSTTSKANTHIHRIGTATSPSSSTLHRVRRNLHLSLTSASPRRQRDRMFARFESTLDVVLAELASNHQLAHVNAEEVRRLVLSRLQRL